MRKNIFIFIFCLFSFASFGAEILDNIARESKKFGDWTISCEEDVMIDKVDCKIFSNFYDNTCSIYIQPNNKIANQVVIIIPSVLEKTNVKFKVDRNSLINSDTIYRLPDYGVIPFAPNRQKQMLSQLKSGDNLYIRFTVRDVKAANGTKEITAKISLAEFSKLLVYYDMKMGYIKQ